MLADPRHPDYAHMKSWVGGERRPFDFDYCAAAVRDAIGEVPASVRLVLDLIAAGPGGGTRLTPGGRLPRALVREVQAHRPTWKHFDGLASTEDDLLPLSVLHDLLRAAGLVRLSRGVLSPTRAAGNDLDIVRRLRTQFPAGDFSTVLAEVTVGLLATVDGAIAVPKLAEQVFPMLGYGWGSSRGPLTLADVTASLWRASHEWESLDLIATEHRAWRAGPSARSLLPGAAGLARVWEDPRR